MEKYIKYGIIGFVAIVILSIGFGCCSVIDATERGIVVTMGKPGTEILQPGLHFKAPFIQSIETYDLTPVEYEKSFSVGQDGAISKDLQTVGVTFTLYWKYDETKIYDVIRNYKTKDSIYQPISTAVKAALKNEIGKYSIEEIIANQNVIAENVRKQFSAEIEYLPIVLTDFKIGNYDWDDQYDKMIRETMNRKQQVEQMKQEVALSEQAAQKQVKEAEARRQAAELDAQAAIAKAKGEAEAKRLEGEGIAAYNRSVAQNQALEIKLKELEIQKIHEEKWNGELVPTYIPLTAAGGIVNLK
jgi:regulator of protease activity HflC (stomatin/prohibitin superfamily)